MIPSVHPPCCVPTQPQTLTRVIPCSSTTLPDGCFLRLQKCGITDANIYQGSWARNTQCLPQVTQWLVNQLWIFSNSNPRILMQISHVHFHNLTLLSASDNNIESIEVLQSIDMPNIHTLILDSNRITRVGSLRKLTSTLSHLDLSNNFIMDLRQLSELSTSCFMKRLQIEYFCGKSPVICDCRCLLKLEAVRFDLVQLPMHLRSYNSKPLSMFQVNKMPKTRRKIPQYQ